MSQEHGMQWQMLDRSSLVTGMNMGVSTTHTMIWYCGITGCVHSASHTCWQTQGALHISITRTLLLVPYWRWCISAAYYHRQWNEVSPFRTHRKTSTLAGEAPHFVLTEEIQSHNHLPLMSCWLYFVTLRNLCFWTAYHITLIADVTIKCFKICLWKWRTSMWLNRLTALSCWRSVPVSIWPPDFSTNCWACNRRW